MSDGLDKAIKVTGRHVHASKYHWDDVSLGENRIATVGRKLKFWINDFDTEPKAVKPVTLVFQDNVVEIVGDYEPLSNFQVCHIESGYHIQGKCGCIVCEHGMDAFTPAERAKLRR